MRLCQRALDVARAQGDADLELCSLSGLGEKLVMAGQLERGLALIDEAMAGTLGGERSRLDTVAYTCCDMLVACDLAADRSGRASGARWPTASSPTAARSCALRAPAHGSVLVATGHWAAGERELLRAVEMGAGAGPAVASDAARLADLRLRQGRLEEAALLLQGREEEPRASVVVARCAWPRATRPAPRPSCAPPAPVADGHLAAAPRAALLVRAGLAQGDPARARWRGALERAGRRAALPLRRPWLAEAEGRCPRGGHDPVGRSAWIRAGRLRHPGDAVR